LLLLLFPNLLPLLLLLLLLLLFLSLLRSAHDSMSAPSASASPSPSASASASASPSPKHILVTGGTGFIGSHTVVELLTVGYAVTIVDNLSNSTLECLARIEKITGKRPAFFLLDLSDEKAVELVFSKSPRFDAVIHFAGLKAVGESVQIPLRYYENNIAGTINLLKAMETHDCHNIVFSSSATVYGFAKPPITEDAPLDATNPYGRTKLFLEHILRDVTAGITGEKWKVVLLRYFNPVGAHVSGLIGEDPNGIPNNLMPYVAQVAVGRRPYLNVHGNDYETADGTGVRDYIHVVDLARGHLAALDKAIFGDVMNRKGTRCEVYNLGTGRGYSVLEMLNAMSKACGRQLEYKVGPRRAGDVAVNFADPQKAKIELGWQAQFDQQRMVEDLWRWQQMNPYGFSGPKQN